MGCGVGRLRLPSAESISEHVLGDEVPTSRSEPLSESARVGSLNMFEPYTDLRVM